MYKVLSQALKPFKNLPSASAGAEVPSVVEPDVSEPFVVTTALPGVTFERVFSQEHVFQDDEHLFHYECQGLSLDLRIYPIGSSFSRVVGTKAERVVVNVPTLVLFSRNSGGLSPLVIQALNGLGEGVNYRQVVGQPAYQLMVKKLKKAAVGHAQQALNKNGVPTAAVLTIVFFVFLSTVLFFSAATTGPQSASGVTPKAGASLQAPVAMGALPAVALSTGDQLNSVEKQILAKVVSDSGIELVLGGKPFVIFSDPNCPSCRQLEAQLAGMDKSLAPVIVPVSFQSNSAEAVASVLCAPNVAQAWKAAIAADRSTLAVGACAKGQAQATANNAAFTALKFDRTPTIVTSSGKVAVGVKDFEGLAKWIKANS